MSRVLSLDKLPPSPAAILVITYVSAGDFVTLSTRRSQLIRLATTSSRVHLGRVDVHWGIVGGLMDQVEEPSVHQAVTVTIQAFSTNSTQQVGLPESQHTTRSHHRMQCLMLRALKFFCSEISSWHHLTEAARCANWGTAGCSRAEKSS